MYRKYIVYNKKNAWKINKSFFTVSSTIFEKIYHSQGCVEQISCHFETYYYDAWKIHLFDFTTCEPKLNNCPHVLHNIVLKKIHF